MNPFIARLPYTLALSILLATVFSSTVMAQSLRYVTGGFVDTWRKYDPPNLTTTVTTVGGRQCGPNQTAMDPCQGNQYPFVAGENVAPIRPTGAVHQVGLTVGGPMNMPLQSEWQKQTSGMIPSGVIPGILSIWTLFDGRNDVALPASAKGLAAGAGPGNMVWNPIASVVPGNPIFQTRSWPSGMDPGQTTSEGVAVPTNFPTIPPNANFGATYTAGPRQFGGTAAILTDTPNRLTLDFVTAIYQRTNGKCQPSLPFGDCQVGYAYGTDRRFTSVRRNVNTAATSIVLGQHGYWHGHPWTTGTLTVMDASLGNEAAWHSATGTDTITPSGARHLVLVTPVMNYDRDLFGVPGGGAHIGRWDLLIQTPEPAAAAGLLAGLGLLGALHARSRRRG